MDLTVIYWILCVALVVAILVMVAGLVAFVAAAYETIRRIISGRQHVRS